ncbi:hypothetical protein C2L71_03075 [Enteroscipio rubneri]|uniref:Uncharacterized protein n=1 Tax=Enteroscipio rubneri TaxID=2070686 RepID=A0A2K2UDC7_9ACTN|nr:hypothetical protein C2L71_03075 [Enteroscipio rubneri]
MWLYLLATCKAHLFEHALGFGSMYHILAVTEEKMHAAAVAPQNIPAYEIGRNGLRLFTLA